eukprot:COSAG02_NODE_7881_length_2805_cov_1.717664_3_plen_75_part_00
MKVGPKQKIHPPPCFAALCPAGQASYASICRRMLAPQTCTDAPATIHEQVSRRAGRSRARYGRTRDAYRRTRRR